MIRLILLKLYFICIGLALAACAPQRLTLVRSQLLMGHVPVNISVRHDRRDQQGVLRATDSAYALARDLEARISEFQADSEVSCLNRQAGRGPCSLSPETMELLQAAIIISDKTEHAFDIRFASKSLAGRTAPIQMDPRQLTGRLTHPDTRIGVGAIGKGFIVDKMLERMRELGYSEVLIDAGGDLAASGGPWEVAIQMPDGPPGKTTAVSPIQDQAWSTSGLYEQGKHILDPRTLKKIERRGSVTVKASQSTLADALATAYFVLGEKESKRIAGQFGEVLVEWLP